jgi:nucleoid DNA-binding protein
MAKTITKNDLVERVASMTKQEPQNVRDTVQAVLDALCDFLVEGHRIELRNFGVFSVKARKPRVGRNPNKPEQEIQIPSVPVPTFKPGKILKQRVRENN